MKRANEESPPRSSSHLDAAGRMLAAEVPAGERRQFLVAYVAGLFIAVGALGAPAAPSRVYLGEHWPSDVLGAYLFAALRLASTINLHLLLRRFHPHMRPCPKCDQAIERFPVATG